MEVQVVGPKGSEILQISGIKASRSKLQIPIPREVDQEGGSFDIELSKSLFCQTQYLPMAVPTVSVEDSYGCKRTISVPGITANVRRVKARFNFNVSTNPVTNIPSADGQVLWHSSSDSLRARIRDSPTAAHRRWSRSILLSQILVYLSA